MLVFGGAGSAGSPGKKMVIEADFLDKKWGEGYTGDSSRKASGNRFSKINSAE
jgi:hypothetical protein